jgi:methylenetetrahydrofolate dehydrogenase (NADP+)/methenyltetrahydrofolate cyclohydrolase
VSAKIIDGKKIAEEMQDEMAEEVKKLQAEGITPGLSVVLVGEDPASQVYVRNKTRTCKKLGIKSDQYNLDATVSEQELLELVDKLNNDPTVNGILVQMPLPKGIDEGKVINAISPDKDVDGFHPVNVGRMVVGEPGFLPCTPHGCQVLLKRSGYDVSGKHVVVVGRSNIVGKPVANILVQKKEGANATVTVCHTGTADMGAITRTADVIIAAAGRPNTVTGDMVKEGVVVIDVGVNRVDAPGTKRGFKLVGDVDFDAVSQKAAAITPVPGGVGPMTITMLMHNTIASARMAAGK